MIPIIASIYVFFLLIIAVILVFVVYHLKKYNVDAVSARLQISIFLAVTVFLIGVNVVVFFFLPLETLLGSGGSFGAFGE